ncbi:putative flagellin [Selenomonas ruminantium subsp. lactilytica TAM6421]|uniref:Flagellin n=2 Tax=Selenomonas ruminantium subsp. lactilytica TaxID=114197 RepID=I0GTS7_SELRL|nr:flagellin [Selenomonas ruminantium]BAK09200.1 flagellin [Selenomonas ruminantium subsp. lactilytica]BAL84164.1 putative flagellin [Selenomonas ruminantium subsp. lactilytica TAM6421]
MAMVVKNNMSAISTLNTLNKNSSALSKSLEKVSSGMKINGAADDASGYAISERMRVQIRGLDQSNANTQNGNAMMKVAEGAVSSTVDILKTLKEKVINAANDTNTDSDRQTIQKELDQSIDQIDDNANITYNGKYLVDGSHNNKTTNTTTALTNESMDAATTKTSALTGLKNRNGESLNIHSTDNVTISYVHEGKTYSTTFQVGSESLATAVAKTAYNGDKSLTGALSFNESGATSKIGLDGSGNTVYTADKGCALTLTAKTTGVAGQISGFTISITTNKGAINKSANAVLDNFTESIRAQNKSEDNAMVFQVGTKANQAIKVGLTDMRSTALGLKGADGETLSVSTQVKANAAINVLDNAIQKALDQQTTIGSVESRLSYTSSNLTTASENVQSSESTIRDADMAKEMTNYTKNNVLLQAAQSMLAQANQSSSSVLSLLQ